jgi:hypothetical protein
MLGHILDGTLTDDQHWGDLRSAECPSFEVAWVALALYSVWSSPDPGLILS